jgi:type II secretory pathway component PulF
MGRSWVAPRGGIATLSSFIFDVADAWPTIERAVAVVVLLLLAFIVLTRLPGGRRLREFVIRRTPGVSQVYRSSVLARFTHTSALAAFSGTPLPQLIAAAGQASGGLALSRASERVADRLRQGQSLYEAARDEREIPALWTSVASATAARGELPAALEELARTYELRAKQWAAAVRAILGPGLLLLIGGVLGITIVGMMLPLVQLIHGLTA